MKKLLFCFGTRPEAIKMAPVILEAKSQGFDVDVCLTGQHREMIAPFLDFFQINENYTLNVMRENQSLNTLTSAILSEMDKVLADSNPDIVFVQGDTTSTFACSLAAFHNRIPVAHIEAGLRTWDVNSPFPEEANRQMTSAYSTYNFAPTEETKENLLKEGRKNIHVTGNTSIDALKITLEKLNTGSIKEELNKKYNFLNNDRALIIITSHRRENHGEPLVQICDALQTIAEQEDCEIVYPVHLNPNVKNIVEGKLKGIKNIHLLPPLEYKEFIWFMERAHIILTDSGGVQEEGPHFKKPILVLRENTERPEAVASGATKLVGTNTKNIIKYVKSCLANKDFYESFSKNGNPYGDGTASKKILKVIKENE